MKGIIPLILSSFIGLIFSPTVQAQVIHFNEVVSANSITQDEDGDYPDWFELHNATGTSVNMLNWSCSDDIDEPGKWVFPDLDLEADAYLQVWASAKNRGNQIFRTLVNQGDDYRFLLPNQAVDNQWKTLNFDDSDWSEGASGFGYGDGDDNTVIPNGTASIFLRKTFTVSDASSIEALILDIDYDDGFVAYINGQEIARANISGLSPAYNAGTQTDHEAQMYSGGLPDRFALTDITGLLQDGENKFCLQGHNISNGSSDFTIIPFLSAVYDGPSSDGVEPPSILALEDVAALHTNFKLSSAGESLYLFDQNGDLVDSLQVPSLPANISIGYPASLLNEIRYFDQLSPAAVNPAQGYLGISAADIQFSHPGGLTDALSLTMTTADPLSNIHYTLDATPPTQDSPMYTGAIDINENTVVRAKVFKTDFLSSKAQTRSYILNASHDLPVLALTANPTDFFDEETGIYVFGDNYQPGYPYFGANFWEDWERPIHLALYQEDGTKEADFDAGVKIFGGWSRAQDQRSLSLFARTQYGQGAFDNAFFEDRPHESYQALVLRNSGNDWNNAMIRDAALTGLMKGADLEFQAYRPMVAYLNGAYWGIYNMREKVNEHFLAAKWNVDPSEIDLLEMGGNVIFGSNTDYLSLIDFIANTDLSQQANYDYVESQIDLDNFALYQAAQIYFNNRDWPGNNIKFARHQGGKWRWILYDTDFGFGTWDDGDYVVNTLDFALEPNGPNWPNPAWSTFLLRALTESTEFRNLFVNRFADEMNSRFLSTRVVEHIDSLALNIASEIPAHFERWGASSGNWWNRINAMKNFANERQYYMKSHILNEFGLPAYHRLNIEIEDLAEGWVQVNSLKIEENDWGGDYFQQVPITVSAIARPGYEFLYWEGISNGASDPTLQINMQSVMNIKPVFQVSNSTAIVINEINYNAADDQETGDWVELYNTSGSNLDLSDWIMKDDDDTHSFVFPSETVIEANGFLIITRNEADFLAAFPDVDTTVGDFDFGLSGNGDAVRLYDADEVLVDEVYYLSEDPWPTSPNGEGFTLELLAPELDNSLPESWAPINANGSPGQENVPVSTNELVNTDFELSSYPNPFGTQINLNLQLEVSAQVSIVLYDQNGKVVKQLQQGYLNAGEHVLVYDSAQWTSGIYYAKVLVDTYAPKTVKLVKL